MFTRRAPDRGVSKGVCSKCGVERHACCTRSGVEHDKAQRPSSRDRQPASVTRPAGPRVPPPRCPQGYPHSSSCPQIDQPTMVTMRFRGDSPLMDRPSKAWALMRALDGLITRAQALDAGLSYDQIRYRCTVGEWDVLGSGVFRGAGIRLTPRAVIRAAALWAGPLAWVSELAAAYWWAMTDRPPAVIELTAPRRRFLRPPPGIVIRRSDLDPADTIVMTDCPSPTRPTRRSTAPSVWGRTARACSTALQRSVPILLAQATPRTRAAGAECNRCGSQHHSLLHAPVGPAVKPATRRPQVHQTRQPAPPPLHTRR